MGENEEPKQETLVKDIGWDELADGSAGSSKYFKPELNTRYDLVIASAKAVEKIFPGKTVPTKMVEMQLASINGIATDQIWSSGSWVVMKTVKEYVKKGTLAQVKFRMRKTMQNNKQAYIFEEIGEIRIQSPAQKTQKDTDAEAFL